MKTQHILYISFLLLTSCNQNEKESDANKTTPDAQVSELDNHSRLLKIVKDSSVDLSPSKWVVVGSFVVKSPSGDKDLTIYKTGQPVGAFEISGIYYRGSTDKELIKFLKDQTIKGAKAK